MQKLFKNFKILFLIIVLGAILRFSYITYNPPSLNWDEISYGYNAYSILETGKDQWGQGFPIFNFRAYGDYPTTLNLYLIIPFIALFGLGEFAIRFPHALFGTLTIVSVYFFTLGVTGSKKTGLVAAFLCAVTPWYLFPSRFAIQSNLSVFFLITAGAFFVNRTKSKHFLLLAFVSLVLTLFSYHTTRIFSPLLLLAVLYIYRKQVINKWVVVLSALFLTLSFVILLNPAARARSSVLFLVDQGAINRIIESRQKSKLPPEVNRLIHNRPTYFIKQFATNYFSYFSPKFLFFEGGTQYQFSLPNHGLLYPINVIFFYLGVIHLIVRYSTSNNYKMVLAWLLLSPVPASLTNESFAVVRASTMLPMPELLVGIGFYWFIEKFSKFYKSILIFLYIISVVVSAKYYLTDYFTYYRLNYSWSWQYGYKEIVAYAKDSYAIYDKIIVTKKYGEPHEFFLFFWSWDPNKYLTDSEKITFKKSNWWWIDRFDKFYFMNDWQIPKEESETWKLESGVEFDCFQTKCLLITSPQNHPKGWQKVSEVKFLNGDIAYEIYANN